MKNLAFAIIAAISPAAFADGFICEGNEIPVRVKVFNYTQAAEGTRQAAVMIISDTSAEVGQQSIARFYEKDGQLSSSGTSYVANVDLRFSTSLNRSKNIGDTALGELDSIGLDVAHNYLRPSSEGTTSAGTLTLTKRDGEVLMHDMTCERYLKD